MKKRNKMVALTLAAAMAVGMLAGCSTEKASSDSNAGANSSAEDESANSGDTSGKTWKIAMCQQHQTNAFQISITEAAEEKAKELGVDLTIFDANQDAATQISQIEQCVSQGYDAILFEPVDPDGLGAAAQAAVDAGVVVINVVSTCTNWEDLGISAFSGGDNVSAGEMEMQQVADLLGGKGNIAILTGPSGDSTAAARHEGYDNILANYPDITVAVEADCQWDTAQAQATVESWLAAYDLDAIICQNDGMAVGAGNAAGANSGIIITGIDATPDGLEAIADGRMTATVSQDAPLQGNNGIDAAVKILNGEKLENNNIITENIWINADNVADYQ